MWTKGIYCILLVYYCHIVIIIITIPMIYLCIFHLSVYLLFPYSMQMLLV